MTKTRAYTSEHGDQLVTADAIGKLRHSHFNGEPTKKPYFSTARPGQRRPVKHVMKGKSCYFAYIEGGGNESGSDGESLNHLLFKEALASLEHVKLRLQRRIQGELKNWREANIRIKKTIIEAPIYRPGAPALYADVYLEFEDDGELSLGTRWDHKLYIEVLHTHPVDATKQTALRHLDCPVIEVRIPDIFIYKISDDETNDIYEEKHRNKIKSIIESQGGFLSGVILSDPCTKAYLIEYSRKLSNANISLKKENSLLKQDIENSSISLIAALSEKELLTRTILELNRGQSQGIEHQKKLKSAIEERNKNIAELKNHRTWLSVTALFLLALLLSLAFSI